MHSGFVFRLDFESVAGGRISFKEPGEKLAAKAFAAVFGENIYFFYPDCHSTGFLGICTAHKSVTCRSAFIFENAAESIDI